MYYIFRLNITSICIHVVCGCNHIASLTWKMNRLTPHALWFFGRSLWVLLSIFHPEKAKWRLCPFIRKKPWSIPLLDICRHQYYTQNRLHLLDKSPFPPDVKHEVQTKFQHHHDMQRQVGRGGRNLVSGYTWNYINQRIMNKTNQAEMNYIYI